MVGRMVRTHCWYDRRELGIAWYTGSFDARRRDRRWWLGVKVEIDMYRCDCDGWIDASKMLSLVKTAKRRSDPIATVSVTRRTRYL